MKRPRDKLPRWVWKADSGIWRDFEQSDAIEEAFQGGLQKLVVGIRTLDFEGMRQINNQTGGTRAIRRIASQRQFDGKRIWLNHLNGCQDGNPDDRLRLSDIFFSDETLSHALLSSFGIDYNWLIPFIPKSAKIALVDHWNDPRPPPVIDFSSSVRVHYPKFPKSAQYSHGSMHAKLIILVFETFVRVAVSSANLTPLDYEQVGQVIWICDCLLIQETNQESDFKSDLLFFVQALLDGFEDGNFWLDLIKNRVDCSGVTARLVSSIPGAFKQADMHTVGHLKMRAILKAADLQGRVSFKASAVGLAPQKWLREIAESFGAESLYNFRFHWPTFSIGSKLAGRGILHYQGRQWAELSALFSPWKAVPQSRAQTACHAKCLVGRTLHAKPNTCWIYVGSHNLSQPAWGSFQRNGDVLQVCSFELGVVLLNPEQGVCASLPYDPEHTTWPHGELPWMKELFMQLAFCRKDGESLKLSPGDPGQNIRSTFSTFLPSMPPPASVFFGDFCQENNSFLIVIFGPEDELNLVSAQYIEQSLVPTLQKPVYAFTDTGANGHLAAVRDLLRPAGLPMLCLAHWSGQLNIQFRADGLEEILSIDPENLKVIQEVVQEESSDTDETVAQLELPSNVKLICLDIDGTILAHQRSNDLMPEAQEFFRSLDPAKHSVALVTNQGSVGLRHWMEKGKWGEPNKYPTLQATEQRLNAIMDAIKSLFKGHVRLFVCFSYETKTGKLSPRPLGTESDKRWDPLNRKPKPGMILQAISDAAVSPDQTLMVGDMGSDQEAALAANVRFYSDFFRR